MYADTPCPPADVLQRLLLGTTDASTAGNLERHVAGCPECARRAGVTPAVDALVQTLQRIAAQPSDPVSPTATTLVRVFRQLRVSGTGGTRSWSGPDPLDARSSTPELPGTVGRFGPFVIHERLGAGGMGVVYRAHAPRLRREVAVKVLRRAAGAGSGAEERLLAEARAAAAVEHDNIVAVYAVEVHEDTPCIVMPLLKGETLAARLRRDDVPLSGAEVARLGRQVAAALAAAHARGLVHRDVKPGNVWLEAPDDRAKLLDFGLALYGTDEYGLFAGTPGYMAPEQIRGTALDARADLFALGCVLYLAATRTPPFGADDATTVLVRTVTRNPAPTGTANPRTPDRLARLIDRLLEKEPADRPQSAADVVAELDALTAEAGARRKRITRRRWLAGVAVAGVGGALAVWFARPPQLDAVAPAEEPPVRVEVAADAEVGKVVFARDGSETPFDTTSDTALSLPPGEYRLRPAVEVRGRVLVPAVLTARAGAPPVKLALVGEVGRTQAHSRAVTGVAAVTRKDGFTVLSSSLDRSLGAWTPGERGDPRNVALNGEALCLAATPDGATVATAGGDRRNADQPGIELWDGRTLKPLAKPLEGHKGFVWALALSADGKVLLSAARGDVRLWDVAKRESRALDHDDAKVVAAALDATGKWALTGDDAGFVYLWERDVAGVRLVKKLIAIEPGPVCAVRAVAFTPTGFVTAGDDGTIRVWNRTTYKARGLPAQDKAIRALAVSKDGARLLSGGEDRTVKLWALAAGKLVYSFTGHTDAVAAVAFTPDGRGAVSGGGSADRTVRLWRLPFD